MTTAAEMVTKLRIAMGDDVEPYAVSTQTIFEWLSDAYLRIQLEFEQWKFFHNRGKLLTTISGTSIYTVTNCKAISADSIYCNKVGETARFPMYLMEYIDWVREEQINLQRAGDPMFLIKLPDGTYRVEPDPTAAWEIWGDIWYKPAGFTTLTSYPIWDAKYHNLVVWEALKVAAMEWQDGDKLHTNSRRIQANLVANLIPMRRAFNYEYLDSKGGARALI